ncbi:MAG: chromosomal replication initiator protein DnaA [Patescibacteria group bacterium]
MTDHKKLWTDVLTEIELTISRATFGTWFRNTNIIKQEAGVMYVGVPNSFAKEWLASKYHLSIIKTIRNLCPEVRSLEYIIQKTNDDKPKSPTKEEVMGEKPSLNQQLGLNDLYINKDDNLNSKYIFDSFVVGTFNELAHAASQAVVKNPGMVYNPLFIYGPTGLGKTHLIQSIGNHLKKINANKKIYYVSAERFSIDYVNSVLNNKTNGFKEKYRKYDVLIMDDTQFLANKDRTQDELFHLFNNFYENNKQIIFSSDKSPKFIPNLEDRLKSRFEGGMIVGISKPEFESRLAILKSKSQSLNFSLPDEIIEYIATVVQENIRELEGALNAVVCQAYLKKRELNMGEVRSLLKNNIKPQKTVSIKNVTSVVADFYNIDERMLYDKTRKKEVVKPRQMIMYILREDCNSSYPYIGQKLGGRDHTTVIHAYDKIKQDLKSNNSLVQELEQIRNRLYNEV